jgi:AcrR family transcriptional regulator
MPLTGVARKQPHNRDGDSDSSPAARVRRRRPGGGRRRDPDIDARVLHAARQAYAEFGWAGFHFDRVAKSAQVSRDVLYRRYADKESLLLDALTNAALPIVSGQGQIRDQLMTYAQEMYSYFTAADGIASLRIHLEAAQFPELYRAYRSRVVDPNFEVNVAALDQAVRNGEIRRGANSVAVLEAIGGGVLIHARSVAA